MGVLQRKKDGTEVISVRVPRAINAKLIELRRRAHLFGVQFQRHVGWGSERGGKTDPPGTGQRGAEDSRCGEDGSVAGCGREGGVGGGLYLSRSGEAVR